MLWTVPCFFFFAGLLVESESSGEHCREEQSINGMALQGLVFKNFPVRAFHECDISCERELTCQSYNYVVGENLCELNNRTKEARPEHFRSDPARVYLRRLRNRGMYKLLLEASRKFLGSLSKPRRRRQWERHWTNGCLPLLNNNMKWPSSASSTKRWRQRLMFCIPFWIERRRCMFSLSTFLKPLAYLTDNCKFRLKKVN